MHKPAQEYDISEAQIHLPEIVERVERGEEVIIERAGTPVAKIVPSDQHARRTSFGMFKDRFELPGDWDSNEANRSVTEGWNV
ncbi:MAG: type II toxin-antitoxin system prevent-host-death family antitoxin [Glycomyces artemisiae]|uniref:Antitoxin n=1 Tax=Glycomyces artemisiae TaxID=1076443 RepID=A0A850CGU5_9ACTN|nr:type II toxin-antitoxin system prevent-host-death family antitoxin [Glycomyces artemisiae]